MILMIMTMGTIRITIKRRTKRVEGARKILLHLAQTVLTLRVAHQTLSVRAELSGLDGGECFLLLLPFLSF